MFAEVILMRYSYILIAVLFAISLASAVVNAAPIAINGATFDAPASCANADAALVCKVDGQQFELWVTRKPLGPQIATTEPMARKMQHFSEVHEAAVANIMRSTNNDKKAPFSSYGSYSALGAALPGKGTPASPAVSGPLLSMQYPEFLVPQVIENSTTRFFVTFKHKSHAGGPNLMIDLRAPKDQSDTAASIVAARKNGLTAMMAGQSGSVDVDALGEIKGVGFAFIGVPDAKKGLSGVETIETTFASDTAKGLLEVRLGSEQRYTTDTRDVWSLLAKSIKLGK